MLFSYEDVYRKLNRLVDDDSSSIFLNGNGRLDLFLEENGIAHSVYIAEFSLININFINTLYQFLM